MSKADDKEEPLKNIKIGKGIQHILDEAYRILGNPILIHDMEYKAIAYTENTVTDDPIWNEYETTGMASSDLLMFFKNECFLESAADAKTITFLLSDKLKYDRIYGKLFTKNNVQIGCACMVACYKPFEDYDPELLEIACDILNKEFCANEFYQSYGQTYMETLVCQLIEDSIEDKNLYVAHIESIYISLKAILRLIVVDIAKCDPAHTKLAYFRDLFMQTQPAFKYAIYSNYIVIIISSDEAALNVKKDLNKLNRLFVQHDIYAGISSPFENLFELRKFYMEAVDALDYGLKSSGSRRIFQYDEIERNSIE